jgi:hypothetical protein
VERGRDSSIPVLTTWHRSRSKPLWRVSPQELERSNLQAQARATGDASELYLHRS